MGAALRTRALLRRRCRSWVWWCSTSVTRGCTRRLRCWRATGRRSTAIFTIASRRWRRLVAIATAVVTITGGRCLVAIATAVVTVATLWRARAAAWRSRWRRAARTWCWHWVWIGHWRAFTSLAATRLGDGNCRWRLVANMAHLLGNSEALRNMTWAWSPGRVVPSTALRDRVCGWHSTCGT
jgi:hypothetical protein